MLFIVAYVCYTCTNKPMLKKNEFIMLLNNLVKYMNHLNFMYFDILVHVNSSISESR